MSLLLRRTFCRYSTRVLSVALLLGAPLLAQPELVMPETSLPQLRHFLEQAVQRSPRMILRDFDEAVADANLQQAKAARLPNIGGFADVVRSREDRGDFLNGPQSAEKMYYRIQMNQPLFHWGIISRNIRNAELRREMDAGHTKQAFLIMMTDIRKKYLGLMIHKKVVERHRFGMTLRDAEYEQALEKRQLNLLSEAEIQNATRQHKRAQVSLAYYEEQFLIAKRTFCRMVGVDQIADEQIADEFPSLTPDNDARVLTSLLARFAAEAEPLNTELHNLALELQAKENDLRNARANLRPRINVIAGVTQDEQSYTANIAQRYEFESLYAGIGISWTIFDGFAKQGGIKAALNRLRSAEMSYDMRAEDLVADAESYARQLHYKAIEVEVENEELAAAESHLSYVENQFKRGESSENDVAQARIGLLDRWRGTMSARLGYWEILFNFLAIIEADPAIELLPAKRL